jgi:hypothetical protein
MKTQFFEKELQRVRDRFNETFGIMTVCNLERRRKAILDIIGLSRLVKEMAGIKSRDHPHETIARFMRKRNELNRIFDELEKYLRERRAQNGRNSYRKENDTGTIYHEAGTPHGTDRYNVQKRALP